jgi:hypothetical protein
VGFVICCTFQYGLTFLQSLPSHNYAAELFQGSIPSIKHSELVKRSFGPPPTAQSVLFTRSARPSLYAATPSLLARRQIWTSAWSTVKRFTPERITNPLVYSRIVALESEANAFPHNVSKQVTLWRAILDMDTNTGHQRIINRWERLLEFVRDASFLPESQAHDFKRHQTASYSSRMRHFDYI